MTFRGAIAGLVLPAVAVLGRVAGHARKKARHLMPQTAGQGT